MGTETPRQGGVGAAKSSWGRRSLEVTIRAFGFYYRYKAKALEGFEQGV